MRQKVYTTAYLCKHACISRLTRFTVCFFALGLLLVKQLGAQAIGNWTFNSTLNGTPGVLNTVSVADFSTNVPTHSFNGGTEYFGENGWPTGNVNTSMYMQFSLTPVPGYQLDISSLVLTMRRSNTGSLAGSGPASWSLRSSLDGFATDIATGSMTLSYVNYTITPGSAFTNIYTAITFRLYGYNTTVSSGGTSRLVFDNIKVNGIGYLLPVRLGTLTAAVVNEKIKLSYTVYNTEKDDRYFIERSADGLHFTSLNTITESVDAAEKNYTYADDLSPLNGTDQVFYRIRLAGNTTAATYTGTVAVKLKNTAPAIKTYIINNRLHINGIFYFDGDCHAVVYNTGGQLLTHASFAVLKGYNSIELEMNKQTPSTLVIHLVNDKGYYLSSIVYSQ